jgi:hypothetical protein
VVQTPHEKRTGLGRHGEGLLTLPLENHPVRLQQPNLPQDGDERATSAAPLGEPLELEISECGEIAIKLVLPSPEFQIEKGDVTLGAQAIFKPDPLRIAVPRDA